ncbi:hypothetical protein L1887_34782 [Cichorium endivia]|nr:hypothetical protein L1887_34782 [Cichorium endivia]
MVPALAVVSHLADLEGCGKQLCEYSGHATVAGGRVGFGGGNSYLVRLRFVGDGGGVFVAMRAKDLGLHRRIRARKVG